MKTLLAFIGALAVIVVVVAAVFFFGGFYSVSAIGEDSRPVAWVLEHVREASIDHHATDQPPGSLDDAAIVRAGARAFATQGCVTCHGGPGADWAKFAEGMNPGPPDLKDAVGELSPSEVFWVVKNGIRMTGMPSFGSIGVKDQEIWSIVAFVKKLPTVSEADYKAWSAAGQ